MSDTSLRTAENPAPHGRARLTGGRVALAVIGAVLTLMGMASLGSGLALSLGMSVRDGDGFLNAGPATLSSDSYAISSAHLDVQMYGPHVVYPEDALGKIRVQATNDSPGTAVFVGIGPTADVDRYLSGVRHAEIEDVEVRPLQIFTNTEDGGPPPTAPGEQTFWAVSDAGTGSQGVSWTMAPGRWSVVIMNADGSPQVRTAVFVGASLPILGTLSTAMMVGGAATLVIGAALIVTPLTWRRRTVPVGGPTA